MQVKWFDEAINDLDALQHYISKNNESAASSVAAKILNMIDTLSSQPHIGRPGRVPNTRELIISGTPYIIPYRVKHGIIEILRVYHCARQWPEIF